MINTGCIPPDATAYGHPYPDAYPETDSELTVTGQFETYMEVESMYLHLCAGKRDRRCGI